jgi:Gluconate 2-dehydrogenase subunit 3
MQGKLIGRRSALKYFGMLSATAAGREFLEGWLPAVSSALAATPATSPQEPAEEGPSPANTESPFLPRFFKPDEFRTVEILTEMIIPSDNGLGAKEARVANYVDFVVHSAAEFEPSLQKEWIDGLAVLHQLSDKKFGKAFSDASPSQREELLTEMSLPEHDPKSEHPGFAFYTLAKGLTLEAFFTSKPGLQDFLGYEGLTFLTAFPGCTHPEHQT